MPNVSQNRGRMQFELLPLIGAGSLRFGMTRSEVRKVMGEEPVTFARSLGSEPTDAFVNGGVQVNYDVGGQADFIETGCVMGLEVVLAGLDVFAADAETVVRVLAADHALATSNEPGYSFVFPDVGVSLWRSTVPASDDDSDGRRFDSVGVARAGYFGRSD